jgi:hypothetical protein
VKRAAFLVRYWRTNHSDFMSAPTLDVAALVAEREKLLQWLKPAQAREMEIRRQLAPYFFPNPVEGTQHVERDGFEVALKHTLTRKLDEAALSHVMPQMPEEFRNIGVLINYKPALVMDGYRALNDEQRLIFDEALTISEGAPSLEIKQLVPGVIATVTGGVMHHIPDAKAHKEAERQREERPEDTHPVASPSVIKAAQAAKKKTAPAKPKGKKK